MVGVAELPFFRRGRTHRPAFAETRPARAAGLGKVALTLPGEKHSVVAKRHPSLTAELDEAGSQVKASEESAEEERQAQLLEGWAGPSLRRRQWMQRPQRP